MIRRLVLVATIALGAVAVAVAPAHAAPAQPTRLTTPGAVVAVAASHSATVTWKAPTSTRGVQGYVIQAVDANSRVIKAVLTPKSARTATIGDLLPGTTLRFRVAAWYGWTRWLTVRRFSPLSAPVTIPVDPQVCSGSASAEVPSASGSPAAVVRSTDFDIEAALTTDCAGQWSYSWTYQQGSNPATPVPSGWTGSATATLTVPKWTLAKYAVTGEDYTFTVTATPPPGTTATPTTANVIVRVGSTAPVAAFLPNGSQLPSGPLVFSSTSIDPDYPVGDEHLTYEWTAVDLNVDEAPVPIVGGDAGSTTVTFQLSPARSFDITLKVCRSDDPTSCVTVKHTVDTADAN